MPKYTVEIYQIYPRFGSRAPFRIKVFKPSDNILATEYAWTIWGAKRQAKKAIAEHRRKEFKTKMVKVYKV